MPQDLDLKETFLSNPFLDRAAKRSKIGATGRLSEKRVIKESGARAMPASGAMEGAKSDAVLGDFRLELKSTVMQSIALDIGWLSKITSEAISHKQVPALIISFVTYEGKPQMSKNSEWICIPKWKFLELIDE